MFRTMIPWTTGVPTTLGNWEHEFPTLMDRFFDKEWMPFGEGFMGFVPRANVVENEKGLEVTVEIPGVKPEEVKVELHGNDLWVTGEKKEEKEENGKTFHRMERRYGEFRRVIPLPENVDRETITAEFKDGVLNVAIPKKEEALPKNINVVAK
jgi:HSP20 family protein